MKTAEEVKQLINQRLIELKELPSSVWICKELEVLLTIIDEPLPCTHIYGVDEHNTDTGAIYYRNFKFCPDCGEKLND